MAALLLCAQTSVIAAVKYAKPTATGTGDCNSWTNACTLPTALAAAESGDDLWVKSGTYAPFALVNGIKIIGGFAGTESAASQSNPAVNLTIVDGGGTAQCLAGADLAPSSILRGFTIRNGMDSGYDGGGGILLQNSSALIVQCIFETNKASAFGGGASVRGVGTPKFINCIFRNNGDADGLTPMGGGAVFAYEGSPEFVNCLFHGNKAGEGGAVLVYFGFPTFINCTMAGNEAKIGYGGALFDQDGQATLRNCILWNNSTTSGAPYAAQIYSSGGGASLARYSNIQGGWPGTNMLNVDPLFVSSGSDYSLQETSPCKNTGENAALPLDDGDLDWDGQTSQQTLPRHLGPGIRKMYLIVDMGAYEYQTGGGGGEQ
jgi:hypothetical protein